MEEILQPIYRIEDFWYAIANGLSCPHTPIYRTEQYLAYLCGADVQVPQPIYRIEQYLAYKCGLDVELPAPIYRQEMFLAKWCGMDVEPPTPIYRIETLLSQLSNGELKTVTGNPISISDALAKPAEALTIEILPSQDLHGYANPWPAGGGANKWDEVWEQGSIDNSTGEDKSASTGIRCKNYISVVAGESYYICNLDADNSIRYYYYDANYGFVSSAVVNNSVLTIPSGVSYMRIRSTGTYGNVYKNDWAVNYPATVTTYSPYSNICPISGWSNVNVYREAQYDAGATPYATINLNGTVYGGSLDVTTGVLTVDRAIVDLGGLDWTEGTIGQQVPVHHASLDDAKQTANGTNFDGLSEKYKSIRFNAVANALYQIALRDNNKLYVTGTESPTGKLVYELATPQTYQLTPTEIEMLLGNNTLWNDINGDMTLEYLADGPADDVDALQILLNNRYVNNGAEDEATDREALEILLGGNAR